MGEINGQAFEKARENTYLDVSKSDLRAFVEEYELAKRPAQPRVCNDAELQAAVVRYSQQPTDETTGPRYPLTMGEVRTLIACCVLADRDDTKRPAQPAGVEWTEVTAGNNATAHRLRADSAEAQLKALREWADEQGFLFEMEEVLGRMAEPAQLAESESAKQPAKSEPACRTKCRMRSNFRMR